MRQRIVVPREVLLVEVERRCAAQACKARTRVGLTKDEARAYCGFKCERCGEWNEDFLSERDVPDWWEELTVTGLAALRAAHTQISDEPGEAVTRLSDAYRRHHQAPSSVGEEKLG